MSTNAVDNSGAQNDSGVTDSATVKVNQNETQGNTAQASAETKNTDSAEYMIPKSRFDEVNNKYKELSTKQENLKAYEQLDSLLSQDQELADEIAGILEKRKQKSQPAPVPVSQSADPIVGNLAKKMAYMEAKDNVRQYGADFETVFKSSGLPDSAKPLYKMHVEQSVLQNLNGALWGDYNQNVVQKAFEETKQLLDPLVQQTSQAYLQTKEAQRVPVSKPNAPMQTTRFKTANERTAFIANGLKAGRQG